MAGFSRISSPSNSFPRDVPPYEVIFGTTEQMRIVRDKLERAAVTNVPVLIQGESGTGKEIMAKLIHLKSPWKDGPFVKVNCPAIPGTLLESELFGYERGAFTGAYATKPGRVETADRGTLFLDEIGDLDLGLQAKLLQVLQDGKFSRIGGEEDKKVDTRVLTATNRNLEDDIGAGTFRQDLYYRLNVVNIVLPSLRERVADIPLLTSYFTDVYNQQFNCRARPMSTGAVRRLQEYAWYGNIRELENVIRRYVILGQEDVVLSDLTLRRESFFDSEIPLDGDLSLKKITRDAVRELERKIILRVLQANHWNRKRAAHALKISYRALLYKIQGAGIASPRSRAIVDKAMIDKESDI